MAEERREQVVRAFLSCVARDGLGGATLAAVAAEAGLKRPAIRHFVGNRDELIRAAVRYLGESYRASFEEAVRGKAGVRRVRVILERLFEGAFATDHVDDDRAVNALLLSASGDRAVREALHELYEGFLESLRGELRDAFPDASPARVRETAFAVLCLAETSVTLHEIGFAPRRCADGLRVARRLVDALAAR